MTSFRRIFLLLVIAAVCLSLVEGCRKCGGKGGRKGGKGGKRRDCPPHPPCNCTNNTTELSQDTTTEFPQDITADRTTTTPVVVTEATTSATTQDPGRNEGDLGHGEAMDRRPDNSEESREGDSSSEEDQNRYLCPDPPDCNCTTVAS